MAVHLLDVNVLLALAWPNHVHHDAAHDWFARNALGGWATCPLTQCGFVRLSSNPRAVAAAAASPAHAIEALRRFAAHPNHEFWADDIAWTRDEDVGVVRLTGHQQVTDGYLVALAWRHRGQLATFDRAASSLVTPGMGDVVTQVPT